LVRPVALPGGSTEATNAAVRPPAPATAAAEAAPPAPSKQAAKPVTSPSPPRAVQIYPPPSWGPPGHPPPPFHHHEPHRTVGVSPEEAKPTTSPIKASRDHQRRLEQPRSTPLRATPPRSSPPPTPLALSEGRWEIPPTPVASGPPPGFFSPAWSRPASHFGPMWGEGSDTPTPTRGSSSFGLARTLSPMASQHDLFSMELHSPAGLNHRFYSHPGSLLSPTVPHGFSPAPSGSPHPYGTTDAQFPLPTLHAEGRASGYRPQGAGEGGGPPPPRRSSIGPPPSPVSGLPDPAEASDAATRAAGLASRVKPRRRR
jgi:hypothetical protein